MTAPKPDELVDGPVFVDAVPGRSRRTTSDWNKLLEPLMSQPLRWALIRTFDSQGNASSTRDRLKHRMYRIPSGEWDFTTRKRTSELWELYARFLGNP